MSRVEIWFKSRHDDDYVCCDQRDSHTFSVLVKWINPMFRFAHTIELVPQVFRLYSDVTNTHNIKYY